MDVAVNTLIRVYVWGRGKCLGSLRRASPQLGIDSEGEQTKVLPQSEERAYSRGAVYFGAGQDITALTSRILAANP